jgi:hypothetical protein
VILIVFALAVWRLGKRLLTPRRLLLWVTCLAAVGTPAVLDLALGTYMAAVPRYAIAALPPGLVLVAVTLTAVRPRRRVLVVAVLVTLAMAGSFSLLRAEDRNGEPFTRLGRFLATRARTSDLIIVHSIPSGVCGVARYMIAGGAGHNSALVAPWIGQLQHHEVPRDIETLARGRHHVLLVEIHTVGDESPRMTWLQSGARVVSTQMFGNAEVYVFAPGRKTIPPHADGSGLLGEEAR